MLPLDIKSLFTNVLIECSFNCLEKRLYGFHYYDVKVKESVNLTKICISQTTFVFNDKCYKQSKGLSIVYPLSPILSDIYMHYFEDVC